MTTDKFPCCDSCVFREEAWICEDCDSADGYELDESLIDIGEDGFAYLRNERVDLPA